MGKLTAVATLLVLLSSAAAVAAGAKSDVVWLKNGNKLEGLVVSEDDDSVVFRRLTTGRKGQTVAAATLTIPRADVLRIELMPDETREKLLEKSEAFGDREERLAADLERIRVESIDIDGHQGWQSSGRHFEVRSTCAEDFVREVTHYLDEVFSAYRECFDVRRNADRKIKVILLANQEEYTALQTQLFGQKFENVAFYNSKDNYIVAFNMVQKEEMERIRKSILEHEAEIKSERSKIREAELILNRTAREVRDKIDSEVAKARRMIKAGPRRLRSERLREVEKWKRDALKKLNHKKAELQADLDRIRKSANDAIAQNRQSIRDNMVVCKSRNRKMFEMLFHEGFHAFAENFLWKRNGQTGVPRWLDEGLASYYEMSAVELGKLIHGAQHPTFVALLKDALRNNKFLPLGQVIGADPEKFFIEHKSDAERASLHYAESWAIVHYMTGRVSRQSMETYVTDVLGGMDGIKAFEKMMGQPLIKVSAAVRNHIRGLDPASR